MFDKNVCLLNWISRGRHLEQGYWEKLNRIFSPKKPPEIEYNIRLIHVANGNENKQ